MTEHEHDVSFIIRGSHWGSKVPVKIRVATGRRRAKVAKASRKANR